MGKMSLTVTIEESLRGLLARESVAEGRSLSNMLERILSDRYEAVLTERGQTEVVVAASDLPGTPSSAARDVRSQGTPPRSASTDKSFKPDPKPARKL